MRPLSSYRYSYSKNGKRYLRQAESSAIRFLIIAEAFKRMAASHVHTRLPVLYPEDQLRSVCPRSARESLSQFSHPFECGAVRFLFWWLFLHLRLRSDNVSSTCVKLFALFSGSCLKECHSFLSEWLEKTSQPPLAKPFGFDSGVNRINRPLLIPSPVCHHIGCRPFVGLEGRDPRDREVYTLLKF